MASEYQPLCISFPCSKENIAQIHALHLKSKLPRLIGFEEPNIFSHPPLVSFPHWTDSR